MGSPRSRFAVVLALLAVVALPAAVHTAQADEIRGLEDFPPWSLDSLKGSVELTRTVPAGVVAASGTLARYPDSQPGDRAMLLTAGHFFQDEGADPVVDGDVGNATAQLLDHWGNRVAGLPLERIEYAVTMPGGPDLAVVRLGMTYQELLDWYYTAAPTIPWDGTVAAGAEVAKVVAHTSNRAVCAVEAADAAMMSLLACTDGIHPGHSGAGVFRPSDSALVAVITNFRAVFGSTTGQGAATMLPPVLQCRSADRHVDVHAASCTLPLAAVVRVGTESQPGTPPQPGG